MNKECGECLGWFPEEMMKKVKLANGWLEACSLCAIQLQRQVDDIKKHGYEAVQLKDNTP